MSDASEDNATATDSPQHPEEPSGAPGFRIGNVLKLVLPLVILIGAGFVFIAYFDGLNLLSSMANPPLVAATGQIIYQGKPLEGAVISTRHMGGKMQGATGWTDDQGRFTLQTDINGYVDGAYAGEHQVAVVGYQLTSAAAAPPLATPQNYASLETTPLRINVSAVPEENAFVLTLEGDPPARSTAGRGVGGGFDPVTIVGRVFDEFDKDDDETLSADELQAIEGDRADRIRQADANEDGAVDRDELLQAFSRGRRPEAE